MNPPRLLSFACLALWTVVASAERTVYRSVDPAGSVTYSDRKGGPGDTQVKNWTLANPSRYAYDSAVMRAESDHLYYRRIFAERREPVPVVIYDPRGWQAARSQPAPATGFMLWRLRWDPNLPASPPPGLERNYYYSGR